MIDTIVKKGLRVMTHNAFLILATVLLFAGFAFQVYRSSVARQLAQQQSQVTPTVTPSAKQNTTVRKSSGSNIKVNLDGSYVCKTASMSAFIKQKKARVTIVKNARNEQYLFDGDCIYSWLDTAKTGSKSCGFGQAVSLLGLFGNSVDIDSILPYLGSLGGIAGGGGAPPPDLNSLFSTCSESNAIDNAHFIVPKNITFTESAAK